MRFHERTRTKGVNKALYWSLRPILGLLIRIYWRPSYNGRHNIPRSGPFVFASNHRSFLDPFIIGTMHWRPTYFVAKKELFDNRFVGWLLNGLGAFPVDRGHSDTEMLETARQVLDRGDVLMIFPEGTRVRRGSLGKPKRGVGRLALETDALVLPCAIKGTEDVRRGWRIHPKKIRVRAGRAIEFPTFDDPSPQDADAVNQRVWPCIELLWEWLGGEPQADRRVPGQLIWVNDRALRTPTGVASSE